MATSETHHSAEAALARTLQALVRAVHLKNGTLPHVFWLVPPRALSEHPPREVQDGMWYVADLINAVAFAAARKRPKGDRSALFVILFDYWLVDVVRELDVVSEFWGDYGFHELVASGLARSAMFDMEQKRLLLEYLTPAEIAEFDVPINWKLVTQKGGIQFGVPKRIAYRRFPKARGSIRIMRRQ